MLESMSAGVVPIVFNFNEGISKILSGCGFVVNTDDIENIGLIIQDLDLNRDLLRKLKTEAIEKIINDYHFEKNSKKYFELFANYKQLQKVELRNNKNFEKLHKPFKISLFDKIKFSL
jgi:glycosyltransferase involved in cell wall biosynthesis